MARRAKYLTLGTTSRGTRLTVPNEIAGRRTLVVGMSGSGKSNTATLIMEQLIAAGEQLVMIDPKGEGWGLRSLADGTPSNLDVILFGEPNADIEPLDETHGPRIADFVVQTGRSVVLSMLGFDTDQSERRFVASFMRRLYRLKSRQANPTRMLVVIDEAHLFVPEKPVGDQTELSGAIQRIARQGRSKGIGTLLIDQRPQDVAKRVITQCETIICHQLAHKLDRDALKDWIRAYDREGQGEAFLDSLASLQPGEGWLWSPAWLGVFERLQANLRETFDAGAAPSGKKAARVQRAAVDLDKLRGELTEVIEKAEAEDPAKLRERITTLDIEVRKLNHQLAAANHRNEQQYAQLRERPAKVKVQKVEVPAVKAADITRIEKASANLQQALGQAVKALETSKVSSAVQRIDGVVENLRNLKEQSGDRDQRRSRGNIPIAQQSGVVPGKPEVRSAVQRRSTTGVTRAAGEHGTSEALRAGRPQGDADADAGGLDGPSQRILNALAWWWTVGIDAPTMAQLGFVAGYKPKGGSYKTYVSRLSTAGLVNRHGGRIALTGDGREVAKFPPVPPDIDDLHQRIIDQLDGPSQKIINAVLDAGRSADLSLGEIAAATGYEAGGGSFKTYLSRLSTLGLIERDRGRIRPTHVLWPEGLA